MQDDKHDERQSPVNIHFDQRAQQVDSQMNAGRDVRGRGDDDALADASRRRNPRMYDDELLAALNNLQVTVAALTTKVAILEYQVHQLNDRLRIGAPGFGANQWWIVFVGVASAAATVSGLMWIGR